jgi:hypothetical protein
MARLAPTLALMSLLLISAVGAEAHSPRPPTPAPAPGHHWVGATVYDREGLVVGPIERLVDARGGLRAEIVLWGHPSWAPMKTLTMRPDGTVVSTMRRYEIFLTFPGCNLC